MFSIPDRTGYHSVNSVHDGFVALLFLHVRAESAQSEDSARTTATTTTTIHERKKMLLRYLESVVLTFSHVSFDQFKIDFSLDNKMTLSCLTL